MFSLTLRIAQSPGSTSTRASPASTTRALIGRAVDHQLDGVDDTRIEGTFLAQGNHAMLDGDEIAVAKVARGAVAARPLVVV